MINLGLGEIHSMQWLFNSGSHQRTSTIFEELGLRDITSFSGAVLSRNITKKEEDSDGKQKDRCGALAHGVVGGGARGNG
jgi:hypothetical protein